MSIVAQKITYIHPDNQVLFKGIDLTINKGQKVALVGNNGSGKSTLLHVLSGLDRPTSGKVLIDGVDMFSFSDEKMAIFRRRSMGFVFQQFNLLDEYSVLNNICMPLRLDGRKPDETFLAEVTKMLGIEEKLKKYPYELSGGEQQMLAVGRALMAKPKMILMDEPSMGLSPLLVKEIFAIIQEVNKQGITILLVEQNAKMALAISDRAYVLETGNISIEGNAADLLNDPRVKKAYLGQ